MVQRTKRALKKSGPLRRDQGNKSKRGGKRRQTVLQRETGPGAKISHPERGKARKCSHFRAGIRGKNQDKQPWAVKAKWLGCPEEILHLQRDALGTQQAENTLTRRKKMRREGTRGKEAMAGGNSLKQALEERKRFSIDAKINRDKFSPKRRKVSAYQKEISTGTKHAGRADGRRKGTFEEEGETPTFRIGQGGFTKKTNRHGHQHSGRRGTSNRKSV